MGEQSPEELHLPHQLCKSVAVPVPQRYCSQRSPEGTVIQITVY